MSFFASLYIVYDQVATLCLCQMCQRAPWEDIIYKSHKISADIRTFATAMSSYLSLHRQAARYNFLWPLAL